MNDSKKYLTIHGHFYQPPRENPWTGIIDKQPSASPYNDWNERILNECYEPNSKVKIESKKDVFHVNNYEYLSFNFGPTLLNWIKKHRPELINKILDADKKSILKNNGHGNAIAQVYNHIIMPLANLRDQKTQIIWGIEHFKSLFGRDPEGIWLSETAIGKTTVRLLIDQKIKFTILSPTQARKIRNLVSNDWIDVSENNIDPKGVYRIFDYDLDHKKLADRYIDVFFYDGPISTTISFENVLSNAEELGKRLAPIYDKDPLKPELINIATDGEVYGHHKKFGDIALTYLFTNVLPKLNIEITNYGNFLEQYPPQYEVVLKNGPVGLGTSWSCSHGVERWYGHCGCETGGHKNWNQLWRKPLREGLNILKEDLDNIFINEAAKYLKNPWDARNDFIKVIIEENINIRNEFILKHFKNDAMAPQHIEKIWLLLEMQSNSMLMFTSCGWFFSDISGIETTQIMAYARKAIEVAEKFSNLPLENKLMKILNTATSNLIKYKNGEEIYKKFVLPLKK